MTFQIRPLVLVPHLACVTKVFTKVVPAVFAALLISSSLGTARPVAAQAPAEAPSPVTQVQLASSPALSPDGKQLAFQYAGDLWIVKTDGGVARQLTSHSVNDNSPVFSPDGKTIAFASNRTGSTQVWTVDVRGGLPNQLTYHTAGCRPVQYTADGSKLLIASRRDHYWRDNDRFYWVDAKQRSGETLLFDAAGENGSLSADGKQLLFTREGVAWWRKGYRGSQASQIWLWQRNNDQDQFTQVVDEASGARSPLMAADGKSFYYVGGQSGAFNLYRRDLESGQQTQLTVYDDDSVVMPCLSADGSTLVYRHLFDFYRLDLTAEAVSPQKIKIRVRSDEIDSPMVYDIVRDASNVAFTDDGLEIAMVAGGDVWVMDTELREPRQVTSTVGWERDLVWSKDGQTLYFIGETKEQSDLWQAQRSDEKQYWWLNDSFALKQLTSDSAVESDLQISPDGKYLSYNQGRGDLLLREIESGETSTFLESWNAASYDWSPDSRWIVYAVSDNDFNSDVFVKPIDGSREAENLSLHPDNDRNPVWSPDGKVIAFTGRQYGEESDIFLVYLQASDDQQSPRDRKLTEALEKMQKNRKDKEKKAEEKQENQQPSEKKTDPTTEPAASPKADPNATPKVEPEPKVEPTPPADPDPNKQQDPNASPAVEPAAQDPAPADKPDANPEQKPAEAKPEAIEVKIDFEGIGDRIRRVSIPQTIESALLWSPDSKKLAFGAAIDGKRGVYTISPPDELSPKLLSTTSGGNARWLKTGNQIVWLVGGTPATLSDAGKSTEYPFSAAHRYLRRDKYAAAFQMAWREMRDNFYDGALNNRNWNEVYRKYLPLAQNAVDSDAFGDVVNMMLGELNGSHLGFYPSGSGGRGGEAATSGPAWSEQSAHFGLRFDPSFNGPGLKVRDVILGSPAWKSASQVLPGETVLKIDGQEVDPALDLTLVINGVLDRDWSLEVADAQGQTRTLTLRPISYAAATSLLYDHYVDLRQKQVEQQTAGRFGYLHIRGMNEASFYRFERELQKVAGGKEGLIIDVRDNGGGSTADHLLTSLTQPLHAYTIPRGGGVGYPADRMIYARWYKPIVVLCNQNSFSNAEIFSHAIKTLERGQVVGVPTAGGVISTGGTGIMDMGFLRKPFRGWYLIQDGQDMELNGCVPHHVLWPAPGAMPKADDQQLAKAIEVLGASVEQFAKNPLPAAINNSQRKE